MVWRENGRATNALRPQSPHCLAIFQPHCYVEALNALPDSNFIYIISYFRTFSFLYIYTYITTAHSSYVYTIIFSFCSFSHFYKCIKFISLLVYTYLYFFRSHLHQVSIIYYYFYSLSSEYK